MCKKVCFKKFQFTIFFGTYLYAIYSKIMELGSISIFIACFFALGGRDAAGVEGVRPGPKDRARFAEGGAEFSAGGRLAQVLRGDGAFGRVGQGAERGARRLARLLAPGQQKVSAKFSAPFWFC
jgi:hypothetical protein